MKTAIVYATRTGHSRLIAEAMARELRIEPMDIKTNPKLDNVDLLLIAGGIYGNKCSRELAAFARTIGKGQAGQVALVTSSAAGTTRQTEIREILTGNGIRVMREEYTCQGNFLFFYRGHPNADEIRGAAAFARQAVNMASESGK